MSRSSHDVLQRQETTDYLSTDTSRKESTPLMLGASRLSKSYGLTETHCEIEKDEHTEQVVSYEPKKLTTLRVLFVVQGTVLQNPVLWTEMGVVLLIFISFTVPLAIWPPKTYSEWASLHGEKVRSFTTLMSGLAAFLLAFYMSLTINRWWQMRSKGIAKIWNACMHLTLLISHFVTHDDKVLSAVQRYARGSLMLLFMQRRGYDHKVERLVHRGVLLEEEAEKLKQVEHGRAQALWSWVYAIVAKLNHEGYIQSAPLLPFLIHRCEEGCDGVAFILHQLGTPIPMAYIHLLGLLVKTHNICLAILMALLMADAVRHGSIVLACQLAGRTMLLPFLYNAILLINDELHDPFSGESSNFPMQKYDDIMVKDASHVLKAKEHVPEWLQAPKQGP
eukprot:gnl/MRDRNA2_/MRDRNA2_144434_c0_seq1.p1 gnl/MRDRNA2_/MRDRNA2_144434_c0~~gnl/MRDRNA2_/MRDRNA2_144434_c0_seq1.p1  ORF type:complete len:392 (-),score=48.61 gnl/MRDRNA2_/MRDRNA2_144434_c0_seq1:27-1202(-)